PVGQSRNGTDYRLPTSRLFGTSPSAYAKPLRSEDSNCKGGDAVGSGMGTIRGDAGSGGDGICGNGDDNGVSGDGGG
nr:hypothetical protein [Tanacetum cinerariifolium]